MNACPAPSSATEGRSTLEAKDPNPARVLNIEAMSGVLREGLSFTLKAVAVRPRELPLLKAEVDTEDLSVEKLESVGTSFATNSSGPTEEKSAIGILLLFCTSLSTCT